MIGFVAFQNHWAAIMFDGSGDQVSRRQSFDADGIVAKEFTGQLPVCIARGLLSGAMKQSSCTTPTTLGVATDRGGARMRSIGTTH
ncbi:hypothetical protein [Bradyrhizobium sp.]|uniref:hypothetical protein n=1 Tax=Bradyrhizobium sp. TaxID=376 RepID=UPI0039E59BC8